MGAGTGEAGSGKGATGPQLYSPDPHSKLQIILTQFQSHSWQLWTAEILFPLVKAVKASQPCKMQSWNFDYKLMKIKARFERWAWSEKGLEEGACPTPTLTIDVDAAFSILVF